MARRQYFPGRNVAILIIIAGVAVALGIASYAYSVSTTTEITSVAAENIRTDTTIQAHDLSRVLANKLEAITNNLKVITANGVFDNPSDIERAKIVLKSTQNTTRDVTDFYLWLDQNGKLVWLSNLTPDQYSQYAGTDLSQRSYFVQPKATHDLYFSTAILSNDKVARIYVSYPVFDQGGYFKGVVSAAIRLEILGKYLESQISPNLKSTVGMMDRSGVVLYSTDLTLIGKNFFSSDVQAKVPDELKPSFNALLQRSLGGSSGAEDLSYQGQTGTIAYEPVSIENKDLGVLYIVSTHNFAGSVQTLIDQQRNFGNIVTVVIGALAIGVVVVILSWNNHLKSLVERKTRELEQTNVNLKGALEELQVHDRLQTEFINIAAHELRTPVQPLLGAAELLEAELQGGNEETTVTRAELEMIIRNAKRLGRLTSDLLEAARIESKSMKLTKEVADLNQKIESVIADIKVYLEKDQKVKISFEKSSQSLFVQMDKSRIFEVLANLLRNAIKFTREGTITVTAEMVKGRTDGSDYVMVKMKDTGTGINPEIMPKLFTRFSSKSDSGTGLGLYISKNIIEAHGGKIWGENNPDGRGATFCFTIPLAAKVQEQENPEQPHE